MALRIIKHHRPYQIIILAVTLSLVAFISIWLAYDDSHWSYIKSRIAVGKQNRSLMDENNKLLTTNQDLKQQVIMLQRSGQIDRQAAGELQNEIKKLQDENYRLKGELEFYQNILATTGSSDGLNIQGMQLQKLAVSGGYHFKLVLTHVSKDIRDVEGMVDISIEGRQGAEDKTLEVSDLLMSPAVDFSYKFRNFKRLEGNLSIPQGFTPYRVIVRLTPKDGKNSKIKRVFNWTELIS